LWRVPTVEEITRYYEPDSGDDPWVLGPPEPAVVEIVPYDAEWPIRFVTLAHDISAALGAAALDVEHIGSTSVPGLAAKDVIDIVLTVADPADEDRYVPPLERLGYILTIREPSFHQHRRLTLLDPHAHLHVFDPDCPETIRQRMFRDWLRSHPADRDRYEQAKRRAVLGGGNTMDYNRRKQDVLREICDRMFRAAGMK
jgi:GrpB-like predicted nucleotidyltransferase (UPF0157 family)